MSGDPTSGAWSRTVSQEHGGEPAPAPAADGGWTTVESGLPAAQARRRRRSAEYLRILAAMTAALLAVDAYVHLRDAGLYDENTATLSQGTLFRAQAAVAAVVAVTLVLRRHPVVWAIAALVAASAAGAVLLYTYVDVGPLGPLPNMYEPTWAVPGKRPSAIAEAAATVLAVTGLALALAARPRGSDERG
jgi:hypothetical protein